MIESRFAESEVRALDAPFVVRDLVDLITDRLSVGDIAQPADEARDIVAAVLGKNRFWPRLHADELMAREAASEALNVAAKRATGMPFPYAAGRAAFRHLTLSVNERVLIPRQETELLVDLVLERRATGVCADIGTGSGAIALALASEGSFDRIVATDIDADALATARGNARELASVLRVTPEFRLGDLLAPLAGERFDVLVSNPPYIAFEEARELPTSVRDWEPSHALFSADHGLGVTRRIIADGSGILSMGGLLALEVDSRRARQVADLAIASGHYRGVEVHRDLTGRDRFVLAVRAT